MAAIDNQTTMNDSTSTDSKTSINDPAENEFLNVNQFEQYVDNFDSRTVRFVSNLSNGIFTSIFTTQADTIYTTQTDTFSILLCLIIIIYCIVVTSQY